ncbi:MAG: hypothetical protein RJS98_11240 [Rhodospirillaceae bacterium]
MTNSLFQSAECLGFLEHWQSLCSDGQMIPTHANFLDHPHPSYAPFVHISEMSEDGTMIVRLMGTGLVERWGKDKTGEAMGADQPDAIRQALYNNTRQVISTPCGLRTEIELAASSGSEMVIEAITLPLGVAPGKPKRLVAFSALMRTLEYGEHSKRYKSLSNVEWINIGAGVPDQPPSMTED